jgi:hypothetical protein
MGISPDPVGADPAVGATAALAISRHLAILADGLEAGATVFPTQATGWEAIAAGSLTGLLAAHPERFRAVAAACRTASAALSRHAESLGWAANLQQQAGQAPGDLAVILERQTTELVESSARQTAAVLGSLATSAPPRGSWLTRVVGRVESWRSDVILGAVQSTEALGNTVLQLAVRAQNPYDPRNIDDLRSVAATALDDVRHPVALAKAVLDWDTWRTNPARAIGHLVPNLAAALAGGEAATASRISLTAQRTRAAVQTAALRDVTRREAARYDAEASRSALVRAALTGDEAPAVGSWRGEGGTALTGSQNAGAEAFHSLSAAQEPSVTAAMHQVSQAADAELAGLGHRLKDVESFKRKLATEHAQTGQPLATLLAQAEDAVRYTVVIDDDSYLRGVTEVAALLEERGFYSLPLNNAWHSGRYRGINSRWVDPRTGAAFEVQFHTPASWWITKQTHPMYEEFRRPDISAQRRAELSAAIAEAYRAAPVPDGVESLTPRAFPPPSAPDPIAPPVDYTVHAAAAGWLGPGSPSRSEGDNR